VKRIALLGLLLLLAVPAAAARLPILAPQDWWPVYAPNSRLLAFTELNGQGRVFTLNVVDPARPAAVRELARSRSQLLPSWSPDSTKLAYQQGGRIWTIDADGTGRKEIAGGLYPAWSPDGTTIAFVQNGVVHAGATRLGQNVVTAPVWSPDSTELAFAESDGLYVATLAAGPLQRVAMPAGEIRHVAWSPDGRLLAYTDGRYVYAVAADGSAAPRRLAGPFADVGPLAWANTSDALAYSTGSTVALTSFSGGVHTQPLAKTSGTGTSFAPGDPQSRILAFAGRNPRCAGHVAILVYQQGLLAGSCAITGTAAADVIDGTANGGDVISAGAGNDVVHAKNGRRDTVDCGPGRDTVYADRSDLLRGCEIVRR
jgi:dipeptidyl aminopeptidase/acylaminoacyl peptidase